MKELTPIIPALSTEQRIQHMETCKEVRRERGWGMLEKERPFKKDLLTVACYGPSLANTWTHVAHPLMTTSGAHDYLISGGIVPDYHVECDPREHKCFSTSHPNQRTIYLMASCSHPRTWANLREHPAEQVKIWHVHNDPMCEAWAELNNEQDAIVAGGSNAGLRALEVASFLGYRRFAIHGMDCSYARTRHADKHPNEVETEIEVTVGGKTFRTSPMLYAAAREMLQLLMVVHADIECTFYGEGLLQALVAEAKKLKRRAA